MKFRYARFGKALRPVIPIKIAYKDQAITHQVLVDSGADICIFNAEVGEALGIKVKAGKPREVFGVGGKTSIYYLHEIMIGVSGWPFTITAGFMPNVAGRIMPYSIVGQRGFFEFFVVKFDLSKEEIELKPKN